jgi:hypothetical protein
VEFDCNSLDWVSQQLACKKCGRCGDKAKHGECYNNSLALFGKAWKSSDSKFVDKYFSDLLSEDMGSIESICFSSLAAINDNTQICTKITNTQWNDYCCKKALFRWPKITA